MNQPVVIINGEEEPQDPGTTLADLRLSFSTCYLTSVENGRKVTHRASTYVLGNQVYTLHIPASASSAPDATSLKRPATFQDILELKDEIVQIRKSARPEPSIEKTPKSSFQFVVAPIRNTPAFCDDWVGEGSSFLQPGEVVKLNQGENESILVARYYSIFCEKLRPVLPPRFVIINGERYKSIPPRKDMLFDNTWFAPDLFVLPHYLVEFQPPYQNAPVPTPTGLSSSTGPSSSSAAVAAAPAVPFEALYGRLKAIGGYPYCAILDAKTKISDSALGDFFHYFQAPSTWYNCTTQGMLFSPEEFVLVSFINGSLTKYIRGKFTSSGTLRLILDFISEQNKALDICLDDALKQYSNRLHKDFAVVRYRSTTEDGGKSAFLGCGAHGFVIEIIDGTNHHYALKLVLQLDLENFQNVDKEFEAISKVMETGARDSIVGVVPNTLIKHQIVSTNMRCKWIYSSYLMPVGTPYSPQKGVGEISISDKTAMLRALFNIHSERFIHGDARYVNCVKVEDKFQWVDFFDSNLYCESYVLTDVRLYLASIQAPEPPETFLQNYLQLVKKPRNAFHELGLNQTLGQLISG